LGEKADIAQQSLIDLFLDEAGYTGADLVNVDQPVYVLASVALDPVHGKSLLDASFGASRTREIKHSRLAKNQRGQAQIIDFFARFQEEASGQFTYIAAHKEYLLLAYLVDFWIEPLAYRDGVNFYERGANIGFANVAYIVLTSVLKDAGRREMLRRFQVMVRHRTPFAYDSFWDYLRIAIRRNQLLDDALRPLLVAERELGWRYLLKLPTDLLDVGDYGLLETVDHWRRQREGRTFRLVHDTSKTVERHRAKWEAILNQSNPPRLVGQDRRTLEFPLPVESLAIENSETHEQLQIADLVAGAVATILKSKVTGASTQYAEELIATGVLEVAFGGVWPTDAVTPEQLDTDGPVLGDAAQAIGEIVQRRSADSTKSSE
jgi:hypothetical protein